MPPFITNIINATGTADKATLLAQNAATVYFSYLGLLQLAGVVMTVFLVTRTVILIKKTNWLKNHVDRIKNMVITKDQSKKRTKQSWDSVQAHFFAGNENDLKIAIIEADRILDEALRNAGVLGTNLGDRLKKVKTSDLPNIEQIWQAHKLRNQIAHEGNVSIKRDIAEKALGVYHEALAKLGALEE